MDIKRAGAQPSAKGPEDWFTGTVRIDPLFQANDPARAAGGASEENPTVRARVRMNGVRFVYPVPPWTESCTFTILASGCPPGQMVTLRIPRPWSRPWGLE